MPLPPDRGHLVTEQRHDASMGLDALDVEGCVSLLVDDHERVTAAVREAAPALEAFISPLVERVRDGGRLIYIGAGTSGRLGVLDASECPPTFQADPEQIVGVIAGGDAALRRSSEAREDDPAGAASTLADLEVGPNDTLLGIAAGGTTPYVLGAIRIASGRGAATGFLTCVPIEAPEGCDHLIVLPTGPELVTGSTRMKAGTATKLALNTITTTLFVQLGKVYSNLMVDLRATNAKLTDRAIRILTATCRDLDRESAASLLEASDRSVKTAIAMHTLGIDRAEAERRLEANQGRLRDVIG